MQIRCPHCHNPIDVVNDDPSGDVSCPSCGSCFNLAKDTETAQDDGTHGKMLGHFQLLHCLGQGAFGAVWKARDTELDRIVAIKIPRKENLTEADAEKFLREARAAAQVRHPNIVSVHEVGREDGSIYIASDFIDGASLDEWIEAHPLTVRESVELCAKIAEALHHAHEAGVVHRDLKPQNILVTLARRASEGSNALATSDQPQSSDPSLARRASVPESPTLTPFITDFGLAKRDAGEITMTIEGAILGTPAYMPPEQARGEAHHADRRSDVYSLGVILFRLLTGELPFRGQRQMLIVQILNEEPPALRKLDARLPRDVETICLKCLEKDPARRYQSAAALAADLRRWLTGHPIQARPVSRSERAWRWCHRNPAVAILSAAVIVSLLAGTIVSSVFAFREAKAARESKRQEGIAKHNETKADRLFQSERDAREGTERQLRVATALRLAGESASVRDGFPVRSLLLAEEAVESNRRVDEPIVAAAENSLRDAISNLGGRVVAQHDGPIFRIAMSPDARWLVTGTGGHTPRLWDLSEANLNSSLRVLRGHESYVNCFAISPNGRWLITGSGDHTARVWDLKSSDPSASPQILRGHDSYIYCLAISPNGEWFVTGSADKTARVWSLTESSPSKPLRVLHGHESSITCVGVSSDSRMVVTGSDDKTARRWDMMTSDSNMPERVFRGHEAAIRSLSISNDGRWLVTASDDKQSRVWDFTLSDLSRETRVVTHISGGFGNAPNLVISPDGRGLLTANGQIAEVFDFSMPSFVVPRNLFSGHQSDINCMAIIPDGRWAVTGSRDKTARVWEMSMNVRNNSSSSVLRGHEDSINCLAVSQDGHWLVTGSSDKTARLWDLSASNACVSPRVLRGDDADNIGNMSLTSDGRRLVTANTRWGSMHKHTALVWDLSQSDLERIPRVLHGHEKSIILLALSADGRWLVTGSHDHTARVWDLSAADPNESVRVLTGHTDYLTCLSLSPDGRLLVTASNGNDKTARIWNLAAPDPSGTARVLLGDEEWLNGLSVSPNCRWLITRSRDNTARVWDLSAEEPSRSPRTLRGHSDLLFSALLTPDERLLVTGSRDATARIWNLSASNPNESSLVLRGHTGTIGELSVSSDGRWLVTGSVDATARVWDLSASDPNDSCRILRGHSATIDCLSLSSDGRWLVTGSRDKTVRVWDLSAPDPIATAGVLRGHMNEIRDVALGPDGQWVVTSSLDGTVRVWDLRLNRLMNAARRVAGRMLTPEERVQHSVTEPQPSAAYKSAYDDELPILFPTMYTSLKTDARWHEKQVAEATTRLDWYAVTFHRTRQALLKPDDAALWQSLQQAAEQTVTDGLPLPPATTALFRDRGVPLPVEKQ